MPTLNFLICMMTVAVVFVSNGHTQDSTIRYGRDVPPTVRVITDRSLQYLAGIQKEDGSWPGEQSGPGITGICLMAFMANGDDPDFGPYAETIRKAVRNIIIRQSKVTGHISGPGHGPMYHHGFAMLALSEAYGSVSEELLWQGIEVTDYNKRSIGQSLELAVRLAMTAQENNPYGAWRYSPASQDADTTVSGTVLMGLLGARNAGIEVPNEVVDKALNYFQANTLEDGSVSYQLSTSHGDGMIRSAIGTLVYAVGKRKDWPEYKLSAAFIKNRMDQDTNSHPQYGRYYMAQALFHSDFEAWQVWNNRIIVQLQSTQNEDGSFNSTYGKAYGTGMSVLALALNYRLLPVYER